LVYRAIDPGRWERRPPAATLQPMTRIERLRSHRPDQPLLRTLTVAWAVLTVIHFTIWTLMATISGDLDNPWWVAISGALGIPLAAAWWLTGEAGRR
jgi:hypothetical protein